MTTASSETPHLRADGVGVQYGATIVLENFDLRVARDEFVVVLGPSGCGKTTLLSVLGGHLRPQRGEVERRGQCRTIFQAGGLFPWLTVRENIAAGVAATHDVVARARLVDEWLTTTALGEFADHYPHQLSGGMRQRVELGRALVAEADTLLFDEPFSALDYQTRLAMRRELVTTLATRPRTVVFVTHDVEEAVQLADRIAILSPRPTRVRTELVMDAAKPRLPTDAAVQAAMKRIYQELGVV